MYRISPLTYFVQGLVAAGLSNAPVTCSSIEYLHVTVPSNRSAITSDDYLASYRQVAGGYIANPDATTDCQYCPISNADVVLRSFGMDTTKPWRNVGFMAAYIVFNVLAIFGTYCLVRMPRRKKA